MEDRLTGVATGDIRRVFHKIESPQRQRFDSRGVWGKQAQLRSRGRPKNRKQKLSRNLAKCLRPPSKVDFIINGLKCNFLSWCIFKSFSSINTPGVTLHITEAFWAKTSIWKPHILCDLNHNMNYMRFYGNSCVTWSYPTSIRVFFPEGKTSSGLMC
jgi:hypothetical protein